jgi:hypothetical protein
MSGSRNRIGATSRPPVQQARVGRRRPAASSQIGGIIEGQEICLDAAENRG